jgi:hypothetical protein
MTEKEYLKAAYSLRTLEDSKRLYAGWAETYDTSFAADMDSSFRAKWRRRLPMPMVKAPF